MHTVEILHKAGSSRLYVREIASRNGRLTLFGFGDTRLMGIGYRIVDILRLLLTHHILREIHPDVFVNNHISALLDSGKGVELRGLDR